MQEMVMHKLFAIATGIYLLGDPGLSMLEIFSEQKYFIVAFALAIVALPWVVSQIDN
jgi:hypothetical protein